MANTQLSLFESDNADSDMPIPLRAARHFGFALQRHEEWYALQDWVVGLTGGDDSRKAWYDIKRHMPDVSDSIRQLPYVASNGRTYKMSFAEAYTLYRIVVYLQQRADRPALKAMKEYLAQSGVIVEEMIRTPSKTVARLSGIDTRNTFTAAARDSHITHAPDYGGLTNATYQILFGAAKKELVKELALTPPQAAQFRDNISELALRAIQMAEAGAAAEFGGLSGMQSKEQIATVCEYARMVAPVAHQMAEKAHVDLLSGRRLLPAVAQMTCLTNSSNRV